MNHLIFFYQLKDSDNWLYFDNNENLPPPNKIDAILVVDRYYEANYTVYGREAVLCYVALQHNNEKMRVIASEHIKYHELQRCNATYDLFSSITTANVIAATEMVLSIPVELKPFNIENVVYYLRKENNMFFSLSNKEQ